VKSKIKILIYKLIFSGSGRTVNERKAELLAAAGVHPAESAPPQMLSDLAEILRKETGLISLKGGRSRKKWWKI